MYRSIVKYLVLAFVCSLFMGGNGIAAPRAGAYTVSPSVGYHFIDGDMGLDDSLAFGLGLGYNFSENWAIETDLRFSPTETDSANSTDVDIWTVSLGALYHFNPTGVLNPYASAGLGAMVYDVDSADSTDEDFFGYYGAGLKYALSSSMDLRVDARHLLDYRSDNRGQTRGDTWMSHVQVMLGFTYQFDLLR